MRSWEFIDATKWISPFSFILQYNIMPETENRSLEDIEMHFSDDSKRITDRTIAYGQPIQKPDEIQCSSAVTIDPVQNIRRNATNCHNGDDQEPKRAKSIAHENYSFIDDK